MNLTGKHRSLTHLHRGAQGAQNVPVASPGHDTIPVESREGAETATGKTARLAWGVRSDIGLVRGHNEDSFLAKAPIFAVCDGMGGHAAGEVASSIAVETLAEKAPIVADDVLLGSAVEAANAAVIQAAADGKGKLGMGSTCTCIVIDGDRMSVAHVGDSRVYLLHAGMLVRLTHDHSYVEELVDAGEITADEARVHPSRSVITRALGSDPAMYADHFTLNVTAGDRLVVCSDGLSSMVEDSRIEAIAVSTATPQATADGLVAAALEQGGSDNVTVVVVDVLDDGLEESRRARHRRRTLYVLLAALGIVAVLTGLLALYVNSSWYLGDHNGVVAVYQGVNYQVFGFNLSHLDHDTQIQVDDLPETTQAALEEGIVVDGEQGASDTIKNYYEQSDQDKTDAANAAEAVKDEGVDTSNPAEPAPDAPAVPDDAATDQTGEDD